MNFSAPDIPNPINSGFDIGGLLVNVINVLLVWAGVVAILFVIFGGFRYMVSMGNAESIDKARQTVLYAILGLIIVFLSYLIVRYLMNDLLGVSPAYQLGE